MQSHPLIFCITFCISIGLIFFPLNPQYTFRSVPHTQSLPGVFAVNISIFVGYKLYKVGGSLVCALATILPSFVIMMLIAMFFARFQDNEVMIRIFNGIRPAVVALILFPCISAVRALKLKYLQLVAPAIATLLIWQFGLSPIYIVLAGTLGGLVYTLWLKEKIMNKEV